MKGGTPAILPQRIRAGTLPWMIAATSLLMLLAAAAALALTGAARELSATTARTLLVQAVDGDRARREAAAQDAQGLLLHARGVKAVHRLDERAAERLIGPYINGMSIDDLPLPILIVFMLVAVADPAKLRAWLAHVPSIAGAPAGAGLAPLAALIATLRHLALGIAALAAGATGVVAILAARSALTAQGATISILHGLGATDTQLARLITVRIARNVAIGAVAGLIVAVAAILFVSSQAEAVGAGLMAAGLGTHGWLVLAALPAALILLATGAAHLMLLASLRRTP
jgi:cell division transport system permease protein